MSSSCAYVHMYTLSVTPIKCYGFFKKKICKNCKNQLDLFFKKMPQFCTACLQMYLKLLKRDAKQLICKV